MGQKRFLLAMLKLIGAICIFVACAFAGWHQASSLEKRRRFLQGAHQGLLAVSYTHLDVYKRQAERRQLSLDPLT